MDAFQAQLRDAVDIIVNYAKPIAIYQFGSTLRGFLRPESDVDIAFLADAQLPSYEVFLVSQQLADIFHRDVDLVDLRKASTVFQAEVIAHGKLLYERDATQRIQYAARTFKEYALLNEERQPVLEAIQRSAQVDG